MVDSADAGAVFKIDARALCPAPAPAGDLDLAEAWKEMMGLPFVFEVWAWRKDFPDIGKLEELA
jgi:predicted solute-binding protein